MDPAIYRQAVGGGVGEEQGFPCTKTSVGELLLWVRTSRNVCVSGGAHHSLWTLQGLALF